MKIEALWSDLQKQFGPQARRDELLSAHTTLRLGGPADIWFPAKSLDQLVTAARLARRYQVPIFMLGGGANLLIREGGIRGLVIENRASSVKIMGHHILAASGAVSPRLAKQAAQHGLSGLEWLVGVPGTIGGAVVNNAGAYGKSMANCLVQAELLTNEGKRYWYSVDWFGYAYRTSKVKQLRADKPIVLQVELALAPTANEQIEAQMRQLNERRKATQPPGATIGSMFKNPPNDHAGRLIEAAGLKGYRHNQAQISPVHANFFVNLGVTTTADILYLIDKARNEVQRQFGITLTLEIEIV